MGESLGGSTEAYILEIPNHRNDVGLGW